MRAAMRERITFLEQTEPGDGWQDSSIWRDVCTVWAELQTEATSRMFGNDATTWSGKVAFRVRAHPQLKSDSRIRHDGKLYEIESMTAADPGRTHLVIIAKERGAP